MSLFAASVVIVSSSSGAFGTISSGLYSRSYFSFSKHVILVSFTSH
jgi:hypothetical protein